MSHSWVCSSRLGMGIALNKRVEAIQAKPTCVEGRVNAMLAFMWSFFAWYNKKVFHPVFGNQSKEHLVNVNANNICEGIY